MGFALSEMQLTSTAFESGGNIPAKHTCEGADVSPPLAWRNAPEGTKSFVIFCHDPDAPLISKRGDYGFVHWVLYNIPASTSQLDENSSGFATGRNNFDKVGYNGPAPPEGHGIHHYYFWILALNIDGCLPEDMSLSEVLEKVEPEVLGMNRLVGKFKR